MDIAITKMSSKGQIVIPLEMRGKLKKGEKIIIIKEGKNWILRRTIEINKHIFDDLLFAKRTEETYKRYEKDKSKFKTMEAKDFFKEIEKW